jgi:hypothetical protein
MGSGNGEAYPEWKSRSGARIVLALYRAANDAFSADDLVSLLPTCPAIASILVEIEATVSDTRNFAAAIQRENEESQGITVMPRRPERDRVRLPDGRGKVAAI